jgi:aryl-alcohol dehydrogenase-like predicted oxidoreductase
LGLPRFSFQVIGIFSITLSWTLKPPIYISPMNRRTFVEKSAGTLALMGLFPAGLSGVVREQEAGALERRNLGRTGLRLSILGFGGIVVMDATPEQAAQRVKHAIDRGVNYFDVAPTYGDAEIKLGPALRPYRKSIVLGCKTTRRDRANARMELEQSLERLETDYFDLYQLHAVTTIEEVETIFAPGGAMETLLEAREEGKVRYLGFSAHSVEAAMLLMDKFDFDTIMFPVSASSWHAGNFGPQVLQQAADRQMGILALKAMARGPWPKGTEAAKRLPKCWYEPMSDPDEALQGLRFTLSHPVTLALPPGNEDLFAMALDLIPSFSPLSGSEVLAIKQKALIQQPLFSHSSM